MKRFFVFHFLCPFILSLLVVVHIVFLHDRGSRNPLGLDSDGEAIPFHNYYTWKDLVGVRVMLSLFLVVCFLAPDMFSDPTNFIPADPIRTPIHIQPEWYFLFAYTILRRIPHKLGGVVALGISVFVMYFLPFFPSAIQRGRQFNPLAKFLF